MDIRMPQEMLEDLDHRITITGSKGRSDYVRKILKQHFEEFPASMEARHKNVWLRCDKGRLINMGAALGLRIGVSENLYYDEVPPLGAALPPKTTVEVYSLYAIFPDCEKALFEITPAFETRSEADAYLMKIAEKLAIVVVDLTEE